MGAGGSPQKPALPGLHTQWSGLELGCRSPAPSPQPRVPVDRRAAYPTGSRHPQRRDAEFESLLRNQNRWGLGEEESQAQQSQVLVPGSPPRSP